MVSTSHIPLLPRYARLLTFGDVLDQSVQLFRVHWVTLALFSAVSLLPPGLLLIWASAVGATARPITLDQLQSGSFTQAGVLPGQSALLVTTSVVSGVFDLLWTAALVVATDASLRGQSLQLQAVYTQALKRLPVLILATLILVLGLVAWSALGLVLFVVTGFGVLGSIAATIALVVWWLRPGARKRWLKWLIILASPFGLPVYVSIRWSMMVVAAVLEHRGPVDALRRSSQLVTGHWFRVASILTVGSLLVAVLLYAPAALINIPITLSEIARGQFGLSPAEAAISNAVTIVLQLIFGSIGTVIYTLTFIDLRNRREGTDIGERLSQLEGPGVAAE